MITYKFKLHTSKKQQEKLWIHANKLNFIYNYFLNKRIENYKNNIKNNRYTEQKELTLLKKDDEILKEIHSSSAQHVVIRLENSYKNFFRRVKSRKEAPGFPRFRSCNNFFGINLPQGKVLKGIIKDNIFKTKQYGKIKFNKNREILGKVKQIYITNENNKFYICITTDYTKEKLQNLNNQVAIDIGLKNLIVASDGLKIENATHSKYFDKQIEKLQSRADKKKKGSNRNKQLKRTIRRLHELKSRKINDFQHKVAKQLSCKYDTIFVENLSVKKMSESEKTGLNKAIRNAKFGQFISFLKYKVNNIILVNPYNTSKTCNNCGKIHKELKLSDRTIACSCGITYDRDENAAKNIFCLGWAILETGCDQSITIDKVLI